MVKTPEETRAHFRAVILDQKECVLCRHGLDEKEEDRGIIEFMDCWSWICSKCRKVVRGILDMTQVDDWADTDIPLYYKRSRKHWLKYLEEELEIIIA